MFLSRKYHLSNYVSFGLPFSNLPSHLPAVTSSVRWPAVSMQLALPRFQQHYGRCPFRKHWQTTERVNFQQNSQINSKSRGRLPRFIKDIQLTPTQGHLRDYSHDSIHHTAIKATPLQPSLIQCYSRLTTFFFPYRVKNSILLTEPTLKHFPFWLQL